MGEIKMGKHEREQHKETKKEQKRVLLQEIEQGGWENTRRKGGERVT